MENNFNDMTNAKLVDLIVLIDQKVIDIKNSGIENDKLTEKQIDKWKTIRKSIIKSYNVLWEQEV
jgi:hypothetical protein|tara:strand:+ start:636 stop:830 length:195 start_codon:yes stop_codon:yes gene_type:complete